MNILWAIGQLFLVSFHIFAILYLIEFDNDETQKFYQKKWFWHTFICILIFFLLFCIRIYQIKQILN